MQTILGPRSKYANGLNPYESRTILVTDDLKALCGKSALTRISEFTNNHFDHQLNFILRSKIGVEVYVVLLDTLKILYMELYQKHTKHFQKFLIPRIEACTKTQVMYVENADSLSKEQKETEVARLQ